MLNFMKSKSISKVFMLRNYLIYLNKQKNNQAIYESPGTINFKNLII